MSIENMLQAEIVKIQSRLREIEVRLNQFDVEWQNSLRITQTYGQMDSEEFRRYQNTKPDAGDDLTLGGMSLKQMHHLGDHLNRAKPIVDILANQEQVRNSIRMEMPKLKAEQSTLQSQLADLEAQLYSTQSENRHEASREFDEINSILSRMKDL